MAATMNHHDGGPTICAKLLAVAAAILFVAGLVCSLYYSPVYPTYSVAIDSASGLLDDVVPAPDLTFNPEFNLTVRVASTSPGRGVCIEAGTFVEVSYRCVMLAASTAMPERLCTEPGSSREAPFVARGIGVRLPGYMMDNLAGDMRNGVHAFEVTIRRSDASFDNLRVESCGGRQVGGDTAAALEMICQGAHLCPDDQDRRRRIMLKSPTKHVSAGQSIIM